MSRTRKDGRKALPPGSTIFDRFWYNVSEREGCWGWAGFTSPGGYGVLTWTRPDGGPTSMAASRFSYMVHFGNIPDDLYVCHHCDNPPCCNPAHLFLGTAADNIHDAQRKGRLPMGRKVYVPVADPFATNRGSKNVHAKLTEADVAEIRAAYATGLGGMQMLADLFGVNVGTISYAVRGIRWKHVAPHSESGERIAA